MENIQTLPIEKDSMASTELASLEHIRERYVSGLALVRYIQLNRQCSEEAAYQRLASFVKQHLPFDDSSSVERMIACDKQSLLHIAQDLLVHDPQAIDKI